MSRHAFAAVAGTMSLMGAFFWAIRGTGGYGGETGGTLAGFGWALLWVLCSRLLGQSAHRPYRGPLIVVAITAGIAFGGFTGYGVYTAWVRGTFYLDYPSGVRPLSAWWGYAMLFICGFHWGGNAGCLMAWCAPATPMTLRNWLERVAWGIAGALGAAVVVRLFPATFLPFYTEGLYDVPANRTCTRALVSLRTIAPHVGLVIGLLGYELRRRDWRAARLILIMALGFAVPFAAGGWWHTRQGSSLQIDWWKNWEMTIGLVGGLTFALAFWLFNRPASQAAPPAGRLARALDWSGFYLWFPACVIAGGAYEGVNRLWGLQTTTWGDLTIAVVCLALVQGLRRWRPRMVSSGADSPALPAAAALLGLIVTCGALVSVPPAWRLANVVLVGLYITYVGASGLLVAWLWRHRESAG